METINSPISADRMILNPQGFDSLIAMIQPYLYSGMKIILITVLVIYSIVALFAIKQIGLMTKTIKTDTNKYIYLIGYIHLIAVLLCLIFAIILL